MNGRWMDRVCVTMMSGIFPTEHHDGKANASRHALSALRNRTDKPERQASAHRPNVLRGKLSRVGLQSAKTTSKVEGNPERTPQTSGSATPLLHKALSALAELQAQIVGIGHSLREENLADKKQEIAPDTDDHKAEAESLRKQIEELRELDAAQKRNTELEGIVSAQADRIRELEAEKNEGKATPATAVQRAVDVPTKD